MRFSRTAIFKFLALFTQFWSKGGPEPNFLFDCGIGVEGAISLRILSMRRDNPGAY